MKKVREVRSQLIDIMQSRNIAQVSSGMDWDVVRRAICSSYFHNAARMKPRTVTPTGIRMASTTKIIKAITTTAFKTRAATMTGSTIGRIAT